MNWSFRNMTITEKAKIAKELETMLFIIVNEEGKYYNLNEFSFVDYLDNAKVYKGYKQAIRTVEHLHDVTKEHCHLVQIHYTEVKE